MEWLQWGSIPLYDMKVILRTLGSVFPHTSLWWTRLHSHLLVVASKQPLRIDFDRLTRRMKAAATQQDLADGHLDDPIDFLSCFIAADDALRQFVADSDVLNTDDVPFIEYSLPLSRGGSVAYGNIKALADLQQSVKPLVVGMGPEARRSLTSRGTVESVLVSPWVKRQEGRWVEALPDIHRALELNPNNEGAVGLARSIHRHVGPGSNK